MRGYLKAAGVRIPGRNEPATNTRVKSILRKLYITGPEISQAVGTGIVGFLRLNPNLPLWAAVALLLEATGRYVPEGGA